MNKNQTCQTCAFGKPWEKDNPEPDDYNCTILEVPPDYKGENCPKWEQSEKEILQDIENLHKELKKNLPKIVKCKAISSPTNERIPFKANLISTGLIYRITDIADTMIGLYHNKKVVPIFILSRCAIEAAALLFVVYKRLEQVVKTQKLEDIDNFLNRTSVGGKSKDSPKAPDGSTLEPSNILNAIDKLDKEFNANIRREYDFLSEFTHPNCLGVLLSYGILNKHKNIYKFSYDAPYKNKKLSEPVGYSLLTLAMALEIFKSYYDRIGEIFPEFTKICEES